MIHRLILMLSALLLMFAVFGFVFSYGAYRGDNDDVGMGNLVMGLIMIAASVGTLLAGLRMQRQFESRIDGAISTLSDPTGSFDAASFAAALDISVDDARDILG
jgi:vacuolar-type H+-ATPase subunit I/STV1